jgi:hypothetical protein
MYQAAAEVGGPSAPRSGRAAPTAEVVAPPGAAWWECTSQTLAHRIMVPPATTSKMIPQSHQSFLSPNGLIASITARQMCGSGDQRASGTRRGAS